MDDPSQSSPRDTPPDPEKDSEWCTIAQRKTKKKKKKHRPVPLENFFSSPARNEGVAPRTVPDRMTEVVPDLNDEDEVIALSMRHYFIDFLKREGPTRLDNPKILAERKTLAEESIRVIDKFSSFDLFLTQGGDIQAVDNIVCIPPDLPKAKALALETILNNVNVKEKATVTTTPQPIASALSGGMSAHSYCSPTPLGNPWGRPPSRPISSTTPPTEFSKRLFASENGHFGGSTGNLSHLSSASSRQTATPPLTPDISMPPPPIQKPFSKSFGGIGTIGSGSNIAPFNTNHYNQLQQTFDHLQMKVDELSQNKIELEKQLKEKEQQVNALAKIITKQEDIQAAYSLVKRELEDTTCRNKQLLDENNLLKSVVLEKDPNASDPDISGKSNTTHLIIEMQKQLNKERLNTQTLKNQLEIERGLSSSLVINNKVQSMHGLSLGSNRSNVGSIFSNGNGFSDSLGLQGLLFNTSGANLTSSSPKSHLNGIGQDSLLNSKPSSFAIGPSQTNSQFNLGFSSPKNVAANHQQKNFILQLKSELLKDYPNVTDGEVQACLQELNSHVDFRNDLPPSFISVLSRVKEILARKMPPSMSRRGAF